MKSEPINQILSFIKTLFCFVVALWLLPIIFLSFACAYLSNELTYLILSFKYPNLTFSKSKKIRTLIDTPKNAGIFHFLLQVSGPCDFERIKQHYADHLTELRDRSGLLRFPKLRQRLMTYWGCYAWENDISGFNISNHIMLSQQLYRGRPVNDSNIQEFVSDLAIKYIAQELPQWQVIVIPTAHSQPTAAQSKQPEHYYILIKVHHLIIAEEEDLHVSEMLQLCDPAHGAALAKPRELSHFVRKPAHIRRLFAHITQHLGQQWQQFIYGFDSLESPDDHPSQQVANITQLISLIAIIAINVCLTFWRIMQQHQKLRRRDSSYRPALSAYSIFVKLLSNETMRRGLSWRVALRAVEASWQPRRLLMDAARLIWHIQVNYCLLLPYHVYIELLAARDLLLFGRTNHTSTYCARLHVYVPLLIYAQLEFCKLGWELYKAPRNLYDVLIAEPSSELNILHMKSYSGRKIVSFSKSIDGSQLRQRNAFSEAGVRESDFGLACLAGAVYDYFKTFAELAPVPAAVNTTCRTVVKGYFTNAVGHKLDNIGGVVFLQLPLKAPSTQLVRQLHDIVERIRDKQIFAYLVSMGQTKYSLLTTLMPSVITKIFINFFAYNFPITITEIYGATSDFQASWGQKVEDVLLFRPPQSKTCLSLNLHRFGDKYRLAIMADTHLAPDHSIITRSFEKYMESVSLE